MPKIILCNFNKIVYNGDYCLISGCITMECMLEKSPKLDKIWSLEKLDHKLYQSMLDFYPEIKKALNSLQNKCPVAPTCSVFSQGDFFRMKGHARSFCMKAGDGLIVFKGSEPFAQDYLDVYEKAYKYPKDGMPSKIESFVLYEHEVYLALTRKAAINCANLTYQFVRDYHQHFNILPHIPLPLSVYIIPKERTRIFLTDVSPFLSDRMQLSVAKYTKELAKDGLAIYAYYYHGYPLRAAHAINHFPGADGIWNKNRENEFGEFKLDDAIPNWVGFIIQMFGLGYVPTTCIHTGNCVQIQNLSIDGGMCDIDSIEPIKNFTSERELIRSVIVSLTFLSESIATMKSVNFEIVFSSLWSEIAKQIKINSYKLNYHQSITNLFNKTGINVIDQIETIFVKQNEV
ncbi:hypothetical protein [Facilibium subflavum]|uniref:hypothetical protein n=1 Tax=Facilibium subflavum TaxID=2219058 RepID=UPI0013C3721A|nr:hypothetical protein [Facilibium subflavum]